MPQSRKLIQRLPVFRSRLRDPESYTTTLLTIMFDMFGNEFVDWTPETIRLELFTELQVDVPAVNIHKIMAGITVLTTDYFYRSLPRFIHLCNVLAAEAELDLDEFDPADAHEMAWAITEVLLFDPPEDPENAFCDEIRYYIGSVVQSEGIVNPPDVLAIAMRDANTGFMPSEQDDPEIYAAFWQTQAQKGDEIKAMLGHNIGELVRQLEALPLLTGDNSDLLKKLQRSWLKNSDRDQAGFL